MELPPVTTIIQWFQGNPFVGLLFVLMISDVVLGLLRATKERRLSSAVSGDGMRRKAVMLILVGLGKVIGVFVVRETGESPLTSMASLIAGGFCFSEGMSIIENSRLLGVKIPEVLTQYFSRLAPDAISKTSEREAELALKIKALEEELLAVTHARRHMDDTPKEIER